VCGESYTNALAKAVQKRKTIAVEMEAKKAQAQATLAQAQTRIAEDAQLAFRNKFKEFLTHGMDMSLALSAANKWRDDQAAEESRLAKDKAEGDTMAADKEAEQARWDLETEVEEQAKQKAKEKEAAEQARNEAERVRRENDEREKREQAEREKREQAERMKREGQAKKEAEERAWKEEADRMKREREERAEMERAREARAKAAAERGNREVEQRLNQTMSSLQSSSMPPSQSPSAPGISYIHLQSDTAKPAGTERGALDNSTLPATTTATAGRSNAFSDYMAMVADLPSSRSPGTTGRRATNLLQTAGLGVVAVKVGSAAKHDRRYDSRRGTAGF
jgi:hypothetical protein